jgi:hypothetical protein
MLSRLFLRRAMAMLVPAVVIMMILCGTVTVALAALPTVIWQTAGGSGLFSGDGSAVLLNTSTGFQVRRASDGVVQNTVTLPAASLSFDARAFSPDKQYIALAIQQGAAFKIEIWRVSNSTLFRTITTNAVRSIKTLDFSSTGLLAAYERFAYGGGGYLRIFRVSDGNLVTMLGPYTHNNTTRVKFSPNGSYLAAHDWVSANGVRVLRTSDWGTALTRDNFADVFRWANDSATVWTTGMTILSQPYQQVRVPANTVQRSVAIDDTQIFPTSVTADGRFILGFTSAQDSIKFLRTSDGGAQVTYTGTSIFSGDISPAGTVFTFGSCAGSPCTFYMAQMPTLPPP